MSYFYSLLRTICYKIKYKNKFNVSVKNSFRLSGVTLDIDHSSSSKVSLNGSVGCRKYVRISAHGGIITIGDHVFINNGSSLNARKEIQIGNGVLIGENVLIYDHDHDFHSLKRMRDNYLTERVSIGDNVWIGSGVIILKGSTIGKNSVIGAGTIVKGYIPDNSLVYSNNDLVIKDIQR